MHKIIIAVLALAVLSGCGLSPEIQKSRAEQRLTIELCEIILNPGGHRSGKLKATRNELRYRGEDCTKHKDLKKTKSRSSSGGTTRVIVKDCSKSSYGGGFWGNFAKGVDGC
jgi:hypothetical protein